MSRWLLRALVPGALLLLQGCSVLTISRAPGVTYDLAVLQRDDASPGVLEQHFGHPVESLRYTSAVISRRDLHEYPLGIRRKLLYSLLSGSAAVYTLGISELSANSAAVQAAAATGSLRAYYGADGRLYGVARYHRDLAMWLPEHLEAAESFRDGFPCHDFPGPSRRYLESLLRQQKRDDLLAKAGNCLALERVDRKEERAAAR